MGIGLRKPVKLIQIAVTVDADGRNIESNGLSFKTWAEVSEPSGFRDYLNGQTQMGSTKKFLVRFRFDQFPNADWKIVYNGREWTVSEIQKVDEKQFYWSFRATSKSDV
jgi:SPP1 family predicted phage head-tail adaptor